MRVHVVEMICVAAMTTGVRPSSLIAQPVILEDQKIVGNDTQAQDRFGFALDMDGDRLVVGAIHHDASASNAGAVYVFVHNGDSWIQHTKILPPNGQPGDWFGYAVAIDGEMIVVGSPNADATGVDSGAAFVYRNTGGEWTLEASLVPPDLSAGDLLGHSIDVAGSVVVVGAERDDTAARDAGAAHVYRFDGTAWQREAKLLASDGGRNDFFGHAVSVCGDTIGVGAERKDVTGLPTAGAAFMFEFDSASGGWIESDTLTAPIPQANAFFGHAIALDLPWIIVGAAFHDATGIDSGAAYLFERHAAGVYGFDRTFAASDGVSGDEFGSSVDVHGDEIVIGAERASGGLGSTGAAYLLAYRHFRWVPHARFHGVAASPDARFGRAVAITETWVACGAFEDDEFGVSAGAVFVSRTPKRPAITTADP